MRKWKYEKIRRRRKAIWRKREKSEDKMEEEGVLKKSGIKRRGKRIRKGHGIGTKRGKHKRNYKNRL